MGHFPIFIDLSAKKCMIFGGGKVALRKIQTLLRFDAEIEVIAREVLPEILALLPEDHIHLEDLCEEKDMVPWLYQAGIVIAATSSRQKNHFISMWCKEHQIPVNVIDAPKECTFLFPSIVKKGDITIGINTSGQSPILSKQVRKDIEEAIPDYYGDIAMQLGEIRDSVKKEIDTQPKRQEILKKVAQEAFSKKRSLSKDELERIIDRDRDS